MHSVDILRAGFDPNQDHRIAAFGQFFGQIGIKHNRARGRTGAGRQPGGQHVADRIGIERGVEQLIERHWIDPQNRGLFVDQPLMGHIDRHLERGFGSALARTGLEHPQLPALDREFDVLHIAVVRFEQFEHGGQLGIGRWHGLFHADCLGPSPGPRCLGQVLRSADPGHHVFALRVDQPFAVIGLLAGRRIAGKGDPGGAGIAHVAEHHRLYIDGSAPVTRNVIETAVNLGPVGIPAIENRPDRAPQLLVRILRKGCAQFGLNDPGIFLDQLLPIFNLHLNIGVVAHVFLGNFQNILEQVVVDPQHHIGIHLNEPTVAVPGEPGIAGAFC